MAHYSRILLDTCILNLMQEEGGYIFDGDSPLREDQGYLKQLKSLRDICLKGQRGAFQFLISPLTFAELANERSSSLVGKHLSWALEMLEYWLVMLDDIGDRAAQGGSVRHRFKLTTELQELEARLMAIPDFRRDPMDRLLLIQYKMGRCDVFLTLDENTIWRHRDALREEQIIVMRPSDLDDAIWPGVVKLC